MESPQFWERVLSESPYLLILLMGMTGGFKLLNKIIDIWASHLAARIIQVEKIINMVDKVADAANEIADSLK